MKEKGYTLAGVDLAWSPKNPSAIAVGTLSGNSLQLTEVLPHLHGAEEVLDALRQIPHLHGISIDAPTIIRNQTGQRACESLVGHEYGGRKAGCYSSNLERFPEAEGVKVSDTLETGGYRRLAEPESSWQIECYTHAALIEFFNLPERVLYKGGKVDGRDVRTPERREGQIKVAKLIKKLARSVTLRLALPPVLRRRHFDPASISKLKGEGLNHNEDVIDAVISLYIAGRYQQGQQSRVFGEDDVESGAIYVPQGACV